MARFQTLNCPQKVQYMFYFGTNKYPSQTKRVPIHYIFLVCVTILCTYKLTPRVKHLYLFRLFLYLFF